LCLVGNASWGRTRGRKGQKKRGREKWSKCRKAVILFQVMSAIAVSTLLSHEDKGDLPGKRKRGRKREGRTRERKASRFDQDRLGYCIRFRSIS